LLAIRSSAACKRTWLSLGWRSRRPRQSLRRCWSGRDAEASDRWRPPNACLRTGASVGGRAMASAKPAAGVHRFRRAWTPSSSRSRWRIGIVRPCRRRRSRCRGTDHRPPAELTAAPPRLGSRGTAPVEERSAAVGMTRRRRRPRALRRASVRELRQRQLLAPLNSPRSGISQTAQTTRA
jgi:hypothetical protein